MEGPCGQAKGRGRNTLEKETPGVRNPPRYRETCDSGVMSEVTGNRQKGYQEINM